MRPTARAAVASDIPASLARMARCELTAWKEKMATVMMKVTVTKGAMTARAGSPRRAGAERRPRRPAGGTASALGAGLLTRMAEARTMAAMMMPT